MQNYNFSGVIMLNIYIFDFFTSKHSIYINIYLYICEIILNT